jgi:CRISPR/Cas system-associated protein Cas5 (RAMP superfamily)
LPGTNTVGSFKIDKESFAKMPELLSLPWLLEKFGNKEKLFPIVGTSPKKPRQVQQQTLSMAFWH